MLDLARIERIRLTAKPRFQRFIAYIMLFPNYYLPRRVRISFEGFEKVPDTPVIYAMNHTDRYNYWPFQFWLWRHARRFTATWVKGKYYRNRWLGWFMEKVNSIPTVSRGYLIAEDFVSTLGQSPSTEEYNLLRGWVDRGEEPDAKTVPEEILRRQRNILGRPFQPEAEDYAAYINGLFGRMMERFVALNEQCFEKKLDLLVFPQGTRSIRLPRGRIGLSQIALRYKRTIVPVGCNGSDLVYPGGSPWAKGGRIVYRFGDPIPYEEMAPYHVGTDYQPFSPPAESNYREQFQGLVNVVMERINELLDEKYQTATEEQSDGVDGTRRFV